MQKVSQSILSYFRSIMQVMRIHRLPGGAEALEQRLTELEEALRSPSENIRCPSCGSTDLEPTATAPADEGVRISELRCKACGYPVALS